MSAVERKVEVGTVWFVWGEHYDVVDDGVGDLVGYPGKPPARERTVRLVPHDSKRAKDFKHEVWVADWRVARYGVPSSLVLRREE